MMATSTATPALSATHRDALDVQSVRDAAPQAADRSPRRCRNDASLSRHGPDDASRREPAWLVDLAKQVNRSVFAIERAVERASLLRDDNACLRATASSLQGMLQAERSESGRRLVAQGRSIRLEKSRTAAAERSADALAGILCDLERQLSTRRERDGRPGDALPDLRGIGPDAGALPGRRPRQA